MPWWPRSARPPAQELPRPRPTPAQGGQGEGAGGCGERRQTGDGAVRWTGAFRSLPAARAGGHLRRCPGLRTTSPNSARRPWAGTTWSSRSAGVRRRRVAGDPRSSADNSCEQMSMRWPEAQKPTWAAAAATGSRSPKTACDHGQRRPTQERPALPGVQRYPTSDAGLFDPAHAADVVAGIDVGHFAGDAVGGRNTGTRRCCRRPRWSRRGAAAPPPRTSWHLSGSWRRRAGGQGADRAGGSRSRRVLQAQRHRHVAHGGETSEALATPIVLWLASARSAPG